MAARSTLGSLIMRLRRMIGDPAGASQVWTDGELQDALDARRFDSRYLRLQEEPTHAEGGGAAYLGFRAPTGDWEEDAALYDRGYKALTPATTDCLTGRWTFGAEPDMPVRLTGKSFDLHAAAADVLEAWAAKKKLEYDFSSADQRFARGRQEQALRELAAVYRRKSRPACVPQGRGDVE